MNANLTKHGDGFYSIGPCISRGHKTPGGQMLTGSDTVTLAFKFPDDPAGVNLDPLDLLSAVADHLPDGPAKEHIFDAIEALDGSGEKPVAPAGKPVARGRKKKELQPSE